MGIITKSQQINTLQRPTWLEKAGMGKGIGHDRQHLGIILEADQVIKVRQTNATFNEKLNLRLLNDGSKTESSTSFGSDWVEVSVKAVSVPFIDTPYTTNPYSTIIPMVEFEYPDTAKPLPVYHKGENESEFFALWDRTSAGFGLVDSKYVIILVPNSSKDYLRDMGKADEKALSSLHKAWGIVENIDGLIGYYADILSYYNACAGLSFEPQNLLILISLTVILSRPIKMLDPLLTAAIVRWYVTLLSTASGFLRLICGAPSMNLVMAMK